MSLDAWLQPLPTDSGLCHRIDCDEPATVALISRELGHEVSRYCQYHGAIYCADWNSDEPTEDA